ncbi:MAG: sensor histidine kinase, partial [Chloroflexota bacterium]
LARRLEGSIAPDALLPAILETVVSALRLPYAAIALQNNDQLTIVASHGQPVPDPLTFPLSYQLQPLGQLLLAPRSGTAAFGEADQRLLADLAHQAGLAIHTTQLTAEALRLSTDLQRARTRLVSLREEERRRLRRDLHDGLGPALACITLQAETARDLLLTDPRQADTVLTDLTGQAQAAIADIRRVVYDLRPAALDDLGLVGAVRAYAAQLVHHGVSIQIYAPEAVSPLPAAVEVAAYRIVQEALTNVFRHAGAGNCTVNLALDDALRIEVADDGRGLPSQMRAGVGLQSMRERAAELGGTCVVECRTGAGTLVSASLPLILPDTASNFGA